MAIARALDMVKTVGWGRGRGEILKLDSEDLQVVGIHTST